MEIWSSEKLAVIFYMCNLCCTCFVADRVEQTNERGRARWPSLAWSSFALLPSLSSFGPFSLQLIIQKKIVCRFDVALQLPGYYYYSLSRKLYIFWIIWIIIMIYRNKNREKENWHWYRKMRICTYVLWIALLAMQKKSRLSVKLLSQSWISRSDIDKNLRKQWTKTIWNTIKQ